MQQRQGVGGGGGQGVESVSVFQSKSFEKCRCQREAGEGMMDIMAAIITSTERRACGGRPPSKSRSRARIKSSSGTERGGAEAPFPSLFPSCGLLPNDTTTMQARFPFLLPHIHPPLLLAPECRRHYYTLSPTQPTMCPKIMNRMLSEDGELQKDVELISFQVTQIIPLSPSIYPPPPPVRLLGGEARSTSQAHMGDISSSNGNGSGLLGDGRRKSCWYEEEIEQNLRWCFALNSILHTGSSQYQDIALLDTKPFGKALVLDGKLQSAEMDEFIYHESLVHPPLLHHHSPKHIFIMGGGEGSTAREVLRHRTVERVVMCDIDQEVVDFCKSHLVANKEAFFDPRLHVIINDAGSELETRKDKFDVIVGDLADPIEGGPCYKLYTKSFYEETLKPRLNQGGIFVTQAGPAGVFSHTEVFSCIYNTLRHVFRYVVPYSAHIPSYADTWGWVMASDSPFTLDAEKLDSRIRQRIEGENRYVDGKTFASASILSKAVRKSLAKETQLYTEGTAKFIYGHGNCTNVAST